MLRICCCFLVRCFVAVLFGGEGDRESALYRILVYPGAQTYKQTTLTFVLHILSDIVSKSING